MDSNMRSPQQWDWENLIMLNNSPIEPHRKRLAAGWEMEKGGGIESVVPCFYGFDGGNSGSSSNFWHAALSKSSQSTSINSSPLEVKTSKFTSDSHEHYPGDFSRNVEFSCTKNSPALEASADSAEPGLCLKLGKRTYFEDVCGGNSNDCSTISKNLTSSILPMKKAKYSGQNTQILRCQVEGCNLDLSSAKDYHRKNRVCENHSKCPIVFVGGLERRFCQQCSRFHALSEFDEKKRSCRKRLSHHNARRRKPQPGAFLLNPAGNSDGRQHGSLVWNKLPLHTTRANEKFTWEDTRILKQMEAEPFTLSFPKCEGIPSGRQLPNHLAGYHDASDSLSRKEKMISFQAPNEGLEEGLVSSGFAETQDHHRALSLLSTTSWDQSEQKHFSLDCQTNDPDSSTQPLSQAFPTSFL